MTREIKFKSAVVGINIYGVKTDIYTVWATKNIALAKIGGCEDLKVVPCTVSLITPKK